MKIHYKKVFASTCQSRKDFNLAAIQKFIAVFQYILAVIQ